MPISVAFFNFGIIWNMCHICRFPILTNIFTRPGDVKMSGCSRVVLAPCHKRNVSKIVSRTVISVYGYGVSLLFWRATFSGPSPNRFSTANGNFWSILHPCLIANRTFSADVCIRNEYALAVCSAKHSSHL